MAVKFGYEFVGLGDGFREQVIWFLGSVEVVKEGVS